MTLLEATDLRAGYGKIDALHSVSVSIDVGEAVTVIGANGAGKTTLMKTLAGLVDTRGGRIIFDGQDITTWSTERRAQAGLAMVPEGRQVFPGLSVNDHLILGAYTRRRSKTVHTDMGEIYDLFPILKQRSKQMAGTLSGGQQQLMVIGRALMSRPQLLLLDEPSLGLAPLAVGEVVRRLEQLVADETTLLLVEQNAAAAFQVASRGYVLGRGEVVATGTVDDLQDDERVREAYLG